MSATGALDLRQCQFLRALYEGCEGLVELRALPSKARHFIAPSDVDGLRRFATEHRRENIYLGVATRRDASGGDLKHCRQLPALFVDVDFKITPEPEARTTLARFPRAPSAVPPGPRSGVER